MCHCKVLVCGLLCLSAMIVSAHAGQDSSSTLTLDEARRALSAPSGSLARSWQNSNRIEKPTLAGIDVFWQSHVPTVVA